MKRTNWLLMIVVACFVGSPMICLGQQAKAAKKKILFYSQSFGYRHGVVRRPMSGQISHAEKIFKKIASEAGYKVFLSQDYNDLKRKEAFQKYDAIVFYTSGDPPINREALVEWVKAGGAFIGIHPATDSYKKWPVYVNMIGGAFRGHGEQKKAILKVENTNHPATSMLGDEWLLLDEYYYFRGFSRDNVDMLISIDIEKMKPEDAKAMHMKPGKYYPVAWTNTEGKGRIFYTSLSHRADVWTNPKFQQHLLGGIAWTLGQDKPTSNSDNK